MPAWVQKNPRPQGGGATTTKVTADVITGEANPFAKESFNLTEQVDCIEQTLINIICSKTQLAVNIKLTCLYKLGVVTEK